ncbi:MAG: hypothetical protein ACF8PN_08445 [Phycisphaerales bacterium]
MTHSTPITLDLLVLILLFGIGGCGAPGGELEPRAAIEGSANGLVLTMLAPVWIDPHSDDYVAHAMYNTGEHPPKDTDEAIEYYGHASHAIIRVTEGERRSIPITYHGRHSRSLTPDQLLLRETSSRLVLYDWSTGTKRTIWDGGESASVVEFTHDETGRLVALVTEDQNGQSQLIAIDLMTGAERRIDCGVQRMVYLASGHDFIGFMNCASPWGRTTEPDSEPGGCDPVTIVRPSNEVDTAGFVVIPLESHEPVDARDDLIGFLGETPALHDFDAQSIVFGTHAVRWERARPTGYVATGVWAREYRAVTLFVDHLVDPSQYTIVLLRQNGETNGMGSVPRHDTLGVRPVNDGQLAIVTRDGLMRVYRVDGTQRLIELHDAEPLPTP